MSKQTEAMKLAIEVFDCNWHDELVDTDWADKANNAITALREALEKEALHKLAAESLNEGLRLDDWPKIDCVNHDCDKCKALAEQPAPVQQEPTKAMIDAAERIDWSDSDVRGNIVNMWQAMLAAAPQPAQQDIPDLIAGALGVSRGTAYDMMREALAEASPPDPCCWPGTSCDAQQEPVAWIYSQGKSKVVSMNRVPGVRATPLYTSPQAQPAREWVGLTDEDKEFIAKRASVYDWHDYKVIEATEAKLKEKNT